MTCVYSDNFLNITLYLDFCWSRGRIRPRMKHPCKYTDESLDRIYGPNNWKMDSENPKKIYYSYTTPEGKWETTWGELEGIYLGKGNAKGTG